MSGSGFPSWRTLPPAVRGVWRWLTLVQLVGYLTSLFLVAVNTSMRPAGIAAHYRGSDNPDGAMQFAKSLSEMLRITHTHLLSMAVIFLLSGIGLSLCERVTERWKRWLSVEPFVALLVSFTSMWLMRYLDSRFSLLLLLSSTLMAITFFTQSFLVLRELGWSDPR